MRAYGRKDSRCIGCRLFARHDSEIFANKRLTAYVLIAWPWPRDERQSCCCSAASFVPSENPRRVISTFFAGLIEEQGAEDHQGTGPPARVTSP
jgi:hypothetical protein